MSEFARKERIDPKSLTAQKTQKAAREMVTRLLRATQASLGEHCCEEHRIQTLQSSVFVTGFMMMAREVLSQTGPVQMRAIDQAFRTIISELTGEPVPELDGEGGNGHAH